MILIFLIANVKTLGRHYDRTVALKVFRVFMIDELRSKVQEVRPQ
jgi:hypothetical protein